MIFLILKCCGVISTYSSALMYSSASSRLNTMGGMIFAFSSEPEIRYTKTQNDSKQLHKIQLAILNAVAAKVKKGGIITYSTCTILQQENDDTVQAFLAEHPEFELVKTTTARKVKDTRHSPTLTILPSDFDSDGFFISSLKKGI